MEQNKKYHNNIHKITVLVTGANGQLGMTFRKYENHYSQLNFVFMGSQALDITDENKMREVFMEVKPDYCVNCAAYTNVDKAEKEQGKAYLINSDAVLNLATICKIYQTILIHISTDYVFDGQKTTPYTTEDVPNPINIYGASKLHGELNIKKALEHYFIIRTSWLYSKEFGENFYRTILTLAKEKKELLITDNQTGCPTDTVNLARFILDLITNKNKDYGIHHFSDKVVMSWYDFAKDILKNNNLRCIDVLKGNEYKTIAKRPKYSAII